MDREPFQVWLESNLHVFENPAVYLGDEPGTEKRDWDSAKLRLVIVGGSTYENLTGNLAAPMLTRMVLESCPEFVVERAFFPNSRKDLEIFEKKKLPVFSLESKRRLNDFDIVAFSASFNGVDLNVIKMLDLCGIPVRRWDRTAEHPFILRGGQNDSNPAPYMNIYDALYIGEAEVNFVKLLKVAAALVKKPDWKDLLKKYLIQMQGVLLPELYHPVYESGKFMGWTHVGDAPYPVKAARMSDMSKGFIYRHPISNYLEEMGSGELLLSRGCGCERTPVQVQALPGRNPDVLSLGEIVSKKLELRALVQTEDGTFSYSPVRGWWDNGKGKFLNVVVRGSEGNCQRVLTFTPDHEFKTVTGFKRLDQIKLGERLVTASAKIISKQQEFLLGTLLGDSVVDRNKGTGNHCFRLLQSPKHSGNVELKRRLFANVITSDHFQRSGHGDGSVVLRITGSDELNRLAEIVLDGGRKRHVNREWAALLTEVSVAAWFMDDGSYSAGEQVKLATHGFSFEEVSILREILLSKWSISSKLDKVGENQWGIRLCKFEAAKFSWLVAPYVVEDMNYKLPEWARCIKKVKWPDLSKMKNKTIASTTEVLSIEQAHSGRNLRRLDITVCSNHNYVTRGVVVHNCLAKCLFCNEGNKERPYRELPADLVVDAVRTSMMESGAASVTLSAFCVSSYRQKRVVLRRLMEEVSPEVGLTSQRVDESAADYEFMKLSAMAGNKSVSFGVEGLSERLRTLVNKHATEEQILQATENAIKAGYNKIKYFCISNLPTESEVDRKEWLGLAMKIREIRDKYPAQKVQMRFNFTDLSVTPHCPFQWLKPTLGQRNLSPFIKDIQALGIRVGFGAGKGHSLDNILQLLHIGDDRLLEPLIDLVLKDEVTYFRQVSKSAFATLQKRMEDRGLSLDMYYRMKGKDEPLPWDIVNYGVKKEYLYKMLVNGLKGKETPKCDEACTGCGVEVCPKKWDRETTNPAMVKVLRLVPTTQHLLMRLNVNRAHRYVPFGARKQLVRRALYLNGIATDRTVSASSDTVRANDWVGGVEYAETRLTKKTNEHVVMDSKNAVFEIEAVTTLHDPRAKLLEGLICHSAVMVAHPVKPLRVAIQSFMDTEPGGELTEDMATVIKIVKEGYLGSEPVLIDARAIVKDLWVKIQDDGFYMHALHDGSLSIYDLYAKLTGARWSEVVAQNATRVDFYYAQGALSDDRCSEGHPLYVNPMNGQHCPRCREY